MSTNQATEATETTEADTLNPEPEAVDGHDELAARIEALEKQAHYGEAAVELLDELAEANQEVRIARSDWANKREATKAAKARLDAANERLSTIVEGWENDSKRPLFKQSNPTQQTQPSATETQADPQEWRSRSLDSAAFSEKAQEALEAAGIHTLGELQDKMTRHGMNWASESGVHGRYREAIEKNFNRYLNEIQDDQAAPVEELQQPAAAMDSEPPESFQWPQEVEDKTVAGLNGHGITTLDELRDWASVRPIEEIPGVTPEQAQVLAGLLAGDAVPAADWRDVAPTDAGVCKRACTALEKEGLTTMGQVVDWIVAGGSIPSLKAVGGPTSEKAAAAIRDFCAEHGLDDPFADNSEPAKEEGSEEPYDEPASRDPELDTSDPDAVDVEFNEEIGDEDDDEEDYFADDDIDEGDDQ